MATLKAHFDGRSIVLDEPATLSIGQAVHVVIENCVPDNAVPQQQEPRGSPANAPFEVRFTPFVDTLAALMSGDEWDESAALQIDPLDAVPADFVRRPGSAAGQIEMTDDFDETPGEF